MSSFDLTNDNYYTQEANERYMSVHQYLDFAGHMGVNGCENMAMAKLKGLYSEEPTKAMVMGSYCDSYFEGTLEQFKEEHPDIFYKSGANKGQLKADFQLCEKMIARCLEDEYFMQYMSGEKQVIMTANMLGCDWKIKIDSYIPDVAIVDYKTSADIRKAWRVQDYGYADFAEYWAYTIQMAVYQKVVEINTGKKLPCYLAVVTKEEYPEIEIVYLDQVTLDNAFNEVKMNMPSVLAVKNEEVEPIRCEKCNYCKATKKLFKPVSHFDLINE